MQILQNTQARPVSGVSFGPQGRTLVAGGSGGYDVWNLDTTTHTHLPSHSVKDLYGCACDPLGRWVYVADPRGGFRLLPLDGSAAQRLPGDREEHHVVSFDLTADGRRLVVSRGGAGMNRVECWDTRPVPFRPAWSIRDGEPVADDEPYLLNQAKWFSNAVALSPDGKKVATAESRKGSSGDRPLLVIRAGATGRAVSELGNSETSFVTHLAFAPDGRTLFAWDNLVVERWEVAGRKKTGQLAASGRAYFRGLAIPSTGQVVVTVAGDGRVRYLDPKTLAQVGELKLAAGKLQAVAVSADGKRAAAGGELGKVVVWDLEE